MTLNLTVLKTPTDVNLDVSQQSFGFGGGVIGRGTSNDWVLDDPDRFLSSKHCEVVCEGDQFFLVDLSTNGTFLNGSNEPIGRGNKVALNTGDQIDVGEYRFKVLVDSVAGLSKSPFDEPESVKTATDLDLLGGNSVTPESMFMSSEYGGAVGDIAPDAMKVTDPLLALDNADDPFAAPRKKPEPDSPFGSQEDSADLLRESALWPEAKQDPGVLPDDWDQDISLLGRRKTPLASHALADDDSLIAKGPAPAPSKNSPVEPEIPAPIKVPAPRARPATIKPKAASAKPKSSVSPRVKASSNSSNVSSAGERSAPRKAQGSPAAGSAKVTEADQSLLETLGLESANLSDDQISHISATVGTMMRESLEGLMQVLRSRASIKSEFRMNVTTIQPIENNPIKFSVNVDELLDTMFVRQSRAYKEPVEAIRESFNSIADHQVAVIAGIRSAFRSAMGQFDPLLLEETFKKSGKGSLVPGLSSAKYWAAYQEHYQGIVNNMERSFQELFADEFVQAYEDQLRKLANARKRGV